MVKSIRKYLFIKNHRLNPVVFVLLYLLGASVFGQNPSPLKLDFGLVKHGDKRFHLNLACSNPQKTTLTVFHSSKYKQFLSKKQKDWTYQIIPDTSWQDTAVIALSPYPNTSNTMMPGYEISYAVINEWKTSKKQWIKSFFIAEEHLKGIKVLGIRLNYFLGRKLEDEYNRTIFLTL